MGYFTKHSLDVDKGLIEDFLNDISEISGNSKDKFGYLNENDFGDDCKWYNSKSDMIILSKKHPEVTFTLRGIGEEEGDYWVEYYRNGKYQFHEAKIVFPDLNEEKWENV